MRRSKVEIYSIEPLVFMIRLLGCGELPSAPHLWFFVMSRARIRGRPDEYNFLFRHCVAGASHFYNPKRVSQICIWTRRSSWERASAWRMRPLEKSKQTKALLCTRAKRWKGLRGCVENRREKPDSGYSTVRPCAQNKHTMHHNSRSVRALLLSNPFLTWPRTKIYGLHGKWNWRIVGNWAKIESFVKISCEWVFALTCVVHCVEFQDRKCKEGPGSKCIFKVNGGAWKMLLRKFSQQLLFLYTATCFDSSREGLLYICVHALVQNI
jgi:hypothetical protein